MITRIVKLEFQKDKLDDFLFLFDETKWKVAETEGCLGMQLLQNIDNPCICFTYSIWESEQALLNYRQSSLFISIWKSIKPYFEKPAEAYSTTSYFDAFSNEKK